MASRESSWQYSPRPRLATITVFAGWAASAVPLLLVAAALVFSGPWDPGDLGAEGWLAEADGYRATRAFSLGVLAPIAALALTATIGGLFRRWAAPLVFAIGLCPALILLTLGATLGMEGRIDEALRHASEPPAHSPLPPPPPPTFTAEEIDTAVRDRVGRSLRAAVGPVVSADGRTIAGPDEVPIVTVACEAGGSAATVDLRMRTGDNITTEQAILDAWMADGYTPDRGLGTNLLYGDEADAIERATLRGNADGLLRLTIVSRCAAG